MSMTPEERYFHDPTFRQLVDVLEHSIEYAQLTPSEIRDAAMLAAIHYENRRIRPSRWTLIADLECGEHERVERIGRMGEFIDVPVPKRGDIVAIKVYGKTL